MRRSEFDKISAALDRAEFALRELRKKEVQLHRKRYLAKSMEEIEALNLEAGDLLLALRKINDAVHPGNPAPHLRLVPDTEHEAFMDKRQPPPRRRLLKSGKILLGKHPVPCTVRNMTERGACLQVQITSGIPAIFNFLRAGEPAARTCKTIWRDNTRIGVMFIQRE